MEEHQTIENLIEEESGMKYSRFKQMYKCRKNELKELRFLHFIFLVKCNNNSLKIAGEVYNKDHATVLHGIRQVKNWFSVDKQFRNRHERIINFIQSANPGVFNE